MQHLSVAMPTRPCESGNISKFLISSELSTNPNMYTLKAGGVQNITV